MGEGLTRRRAGGAGTSTSPIIGSDPDQQQPSTSDNNNNNKSSSSAAQKPSSSAGTGGGKVAYDPRDFQDDAESNKMPRLTLMEEVLLLGLKDKAVSPCSLPCCSLISLPHPRYQTLTWTVWTLEIELGLENQARNRTRRLADACLLVGLPIILERQHLIRSSRMYPHRVSPP